MRSLNIIDDIGNLPDVIGGVVNFWSDPWGNMYAAGREAVMSLAGTVIPAITESTLPDLTLPSFLSAYAVSFALSILVAILLLVGQFVRTARGRMSGEELFESVAMYFPGFLVGISFGPAIGVMFVELIRALSRSIIEWTYGGTVLEMVDTFGKVALEDPSLIAGGAYIGFLIIWAMAIGLLIVVCLFVFQLVILYFSGVLIPLAVVYIVDQQRRSGGMAAVKIWIGLLLIHPTLFFMLGFAFRLTIDSIGQWGDDGFKNLVMLLVAMIAIFLAEIAPFVLVSWATKHLAGQSSSGSASPSMPIGAQSLASARNSGGSTVAPRSTQAVRANATPANAQGATASIGAKGVSGGGAAAGRGAAQAGTATAGRGAAATASKAAGPAVAAGAVALQGANTVGRKVNETAHTPVGAPPTLGKDRPE
ncbi:MULTISPECIES: hypothetical protein [Microbacterium]|jgi:hypothetical protein|uniref:hypothetical protein n=1 Tax=Microbacterium TaxID=33882 RepID=UPI0005AC0BD9|nr:hypothetical protein [Microbacterium sp. MEJ108Y]KIP89920.1 hypothetical protein RU09_12210 [Microbacterium sp. MEJ108Y]